MLSFSLVMTKTLKFLTALIALTLATPALAQGPGVTPPPMGGDDVSEASITSFFFNCHWYRSASVLNSSPFTYADGTPLQGGDVIALLFVVPEKGVTFGADGELPFSINADSTVALKAGAKRAVWAGFLSPSTKNKGVAINPDDLGYPRGTWYSDHAFLDLAFHWPSSVEGVGAAETCEIYLVALGTRAWEWDAETQSYVSVSANMNPIPEGDKATCDLPTCITEWSAVWCGKVTVGDRFTGGPQGDVAVNLSDEGYEFLKSIDTTFEEYASGVIASVDKTPTLEKTIVGGQELAGAELEAALKPTVSGMATTTIVGEDGRETPAFGLTLTPAQLSDLSTYTLYTATDLNGPWQSFDTVLLEEKGLAIPSGMRYTTLRIDGEESVLMTIPRLEKDPTRFYRLQGDVEVVTTGQEGE